MKKLSLPLLLISLLLIMGLACEELDDIVGPKLGETLIDTTISVSHSNAIISIEQGVTVTIPKGLAPGEFKLTIKAVDKPPATPDIMSLIKCYDIKLSIGEEFDDYITIRFDLSADIFENKQESDFSFGFYNIYDKKWAMFSDYKVNMEQHYVECRTNHLTMVGLFEFITSGGYPYKFVGDGVTVYYASGKNAPMSWSDYRPSDQPWHLPSSDKNWAFEYIQDIAYYTAEARKILSQSPHNLNVSKGNINIYVTDLKGNDGEYGSVSGAMYINNKMKLPINVSGIAYEDLLKATCAHELMHYIQDNYYVMNKSKIGLWWLEATATQADRMVWGDNLTYSESELYSIESLATLHETLSKSWDDCNEDPNFYLAGCFLQYMSYYREGAKLNIANSIKKGGELTLSLMRVILNNQIQDELGTSLWGEYHDYVLYLFTKGNDKLSAFPYTKYFDDIETSPTLTKKVMMSEKDNNQTVSVSLPYLSTRLISVSNFENTDLSINYQMTGYDPSLEVYLCKVDEAAGKLTIIDNLYQNATGDIDLKGRVAGIYDKFVILIINTSFTAGSKEATFVFKTDTDSDFRQFLKQTNWFSQDLRGIEVTYEHISRTTRYNNESESKDTYTSDYGLSLGTQDIKVAHNAAFKPLIWSGNSFSTDWDTTADNKKYTFNVSGTVSADGKTLNSLSWKWSIKLNTEFVSGDGTVYKDEMDYIKELILADIPLYTYHPNSSVWYRNKGDIIKQKIIKYLDYRRTYNSIKGSSKNEITENIHTSQSIKFKSDSELSVIFSKN